MRILAFESSAKSASVAISEDGNLVSQFFQSSGLTHSRTLLKMCSDMLDSTALRVSDMDIIAVASGPGSFTGIRIGVAAAKGMAFGAGIPICGVSTLEAMSRAAAVRDDVIICPVMDASRNQVYNSKFRIRNAVFERLCEDRPISLEDLIRESETDDIPYFLIGDGAVLCYNAFRESGIDANLAPVYIRYQSAWGVCLAAEHADPCSPDDLVPNYLRLSQAERERLGKDT